MRACTRTLTAGARSRARRMLPAAARGVPRRGEGRRRRRIARAATTPRTPRDETRGHPDARRFNRSAAPPRGILSHQVSSSRCPRRLSALGDSSPSFVSVVRRPLRFRRNRMPFDPVDPRIEAYMRTLAARHDEPVLLEMEALARERRFPIVGRLVGELLEVLALSIVA